MDAGALDRRVRLQSPLMQDDGRQNRIVGWDDVATVWARYAPLKGKEAREALGQEARQPAIFQIRWSRSVAMIDASWRLIFEGRIYEVQSAAEIGRRDGIELQTIAGDDRGV